MDRLSSVASSSSPVCQAVEDGWLFPRGGDGGKASRSEWNQPGVGMHEKGGGQAGQLPKEGGGQTDPEGW